MNDAQLKSRLKAGRPGKYRVDQGLYFRVTPEGSGFWILRYSIGGRRRELTLGRYGRAPLGIPLADARLKASLAKAKVHQGVDPLVERRRTHLINIKTVDDVAADWLSERERRIENPQIPRRVYRRDISPAIGELSVTRVNPRDILAILRAINASGRPTIANDALLYCRQLFNHAIKLGLITTNPAAAFSMHDAGGTESSRQRALSLSELKIVFEVFRENQQVMTRENYLAIALLAVLGVRKGELIAARWDELDFEKNTWTLNSDRTKTNSGIVIPLPDKIIPWLRELSVRACGSEYVFPSRRASKRRGYISDDTLNHALSKLFGQKIGGNRKSHPDVLGQAGIEHFVIHDLRRTCRSLLAQNGVPPHIAERCLNHKLRGVAAVYDRYDYLDERRNALSQLAKQILPLVGETFVTEDI